MKKCAYCDKTDVKITNEHIVSKAFIKKYYEVGRGYSNFEDKYTENFPTVRDVCSKCNNENLNKLDVYFLNFYGKYIPENIVNSASEIKIEFDFDKLSKWLLKTLYNSERKNAYSHLPQKLHRYKNYILGKDSRTKLFRIYLELIQDKPKEEIRKFHDDKSIEIPDKINFLKLGNTVIENKLNRESISIVKYFASSNFIFHVFILDIGEQNERSFQVLLNNYLKAHRIDRMTFINPTQTQATLKASCRTIINMLEVTYEGSKHLTERMSEQF
jgi:hypothetical protein